MTKIDQELLMRYADGELSPLEARRLDLLLGRDIEANARVAQFREQRVMVEEAFSGINPPDLNHLTQHVDQAFAERREQARLRSRRKIAWPMALAASIAIGMISLGVGYLAGVSQFQSTVDNLSATLRRDRMMASGILSKALETSESGTPFILTGERSEIEITPVRTFRSASGKWCREYDQRITDAEDVESLNGVACRGADGKWQRAFERPDNI